MIFGQSYPMFKNLNETQTVLLEHSVTEANYYEANVVEHQSIVNGKRAYTMVSPPHKSFVVTLNLFEYNNPLAKHNEIISYLYSYVNFYPHSDNTTRKFEVYFFDAAISYLEPDNYNYPIMTMTFKTKEPTAII